VHPFWKPEKKKVSLITLRNSCKEAEQDSQVACQWHLRPIAVPVSLDPYSIRFANRSASKCASIQQYPRAKKWPPAHSSTSLADSPKSVRRKQVWRCMHASPNIGGEPARVPLVSLFISLFIKLSLSVCPKLFKLRF
jgi:hypothetical protein